MVPQGPKLNSTEQYKVHKHYKQSPTNILNDQLHHKTHTLFDTITHARHTNISAVSTTMNQKITPIALATPSIDNGAHGTRKLLINTQVSKDFA